MYRAPRYTCFHLGKIPSLCCQTASAEIRSTRSTSWHTHTSDLSVNIRPLNYNNSESRYFISQCLACGFTDDQVSTLIHFELAGVGRSVLLTEPLHFFTLCAGQTRHTNSTALQHRAQVLLNR